MHACVSDLWKCFDESFPDLVIDSAFVQLFVMTGGKHIIYTCLQKKGSRKSIFKPHTSSQKK